ncbi:DUF5123 domain-containing protein [Flavobacterium sp. IR1]|nr:DUF5123 domain-containing protein [Flavobacterium sp. IR1]
MFMKTKSIIKGLLATLILAFSISGCDSFNDEVLDDITTTREFSPIGLTARVRSQTIVELNWTPSEKADHYVVEFSADDADFKTIYKTIQVTAAELPLQVQLEGETVYSIRLKAVSATGIADSKWTLITATTLSEQIFIAGLDTDIDAKFAILRWTPNSAVTHIVVNPGEIKRTLTDEEKAAGVVTITDLTGETDYTVDLFNNTKKRGVASFKTGIDIGSGVLIQPTDDLVAAIAAASPGATLVLAAGDYPFTGDISLSKPITIRGLRSFDKPKLHVTFTVTASATSLSLIDLDLEASTIVNASLITMSGASAMWDDILISGCKVHEYTRALISANAASAKVKSFTVDNTIVKNVNTNSGADFIDFRNTHVTDIVVKNSTFDTCSTNRDFVRVDAATGLTGQGLTTNVLIDACTLYKVSDVTASKRILYIRFISNASTVRNTLIADVAPTTVYMSQTTLTPPTFSNNNYFNAPGFKDTGIASNRVDASGTTLNPQFADAAAGDFTLKNQTLIDNAVGDPRWRK